ncbi:MAG: hypothetical protein V4726_22130 [Verrucomicrobiota bacterium]
MAREKNKIDTIQITLAVTEPIRDMLESLSTSGFFGKNAADTAAILLREKLRELYGRPQTPGFIPAASPGLFGTPPGPALGF